MSSKLPSHIARYEVVARLSHGGMGEVYRARDPKLGGRPVVIKVPRFADDVLRARLLQEAAIAGNLIHPNIVTIYDSGEHEGQPFIVMEFVEGTTLSLIIRDRTALPLARRLELFVQMADGLEYAHTFAGEGIAGIVHRDIKPENLIIDRKGTLRILDFGIARMTDSRMTIDRSAIGTPSYMSPEQVAGGPIDHRSDIFSAGLVLYELLSTEQAYPGTNFHTVMNAVTTQMPRPLRELVPDIDPGLDAIVMRAIQKDPARRYQSMADMAADVRRISAGRLHEPLSPARRGDAWTPPRPPARPSTPGHTAPTVPTPRPPTPRSDAHRAAMSRRRLDAIEGHLRTATEAFAAGDYEAAIAAGEAAALIDPDEPRALELIDRARATLDARRIDACLDDARTALAGRHYDQALAAIDRALDVDAGSERAIALRHEVEDAKARDEAVESAIGRAHQLLAEGRFESAIRAASEALVYDPLHHDAHELSRIALRGLEEQRQREAHARAARTLADEQRRTFAAGHRHEAIEALERFSPPHEAVTTVLEDLRRELAELEAWVEEQIRGARAALDARRYTEAIATLERAHDRVPDDARIEGLVADARQAQVEDRERQRRALAEKMSGARSALAAGQLEEAQAQARAARELSPGEPEVLALESEIQRAMAARRRQAELDRAASAAVEQCRLLFKAGQHETALSILERFTPPHPMVTSALSDMRAEAAALEAKARAEAEARKRAEAVRVALNRARQLRAAGQHALAIQAASDVLAIDPTHEEARAISRDSTRDLEQQRTREAHDKAARQLTAEQTAAFQKGRRREAIAALEQFSPAHETVTATLNELRHQLAALEDWAAGQVDAAREALAEGRFQDAIASLRHVADVLPDAIGVDTLLAAATAAQAEAEQRARQAAAAKGRAARSALTAGRLDEAASLLEELLQQTPDDPEALAIESDLHLAIEQRRRRDDDERRRRDDEARRRREEEDARRRREEEDARRRREEEEARRRRDEDDARRRRDEDDARRRRDEQQAAARRMHTGPSYQPIPSAPPPIEPPFDGAGEDEEPFDPDATRLIQAPAPRTPTPVPTQHTPPPIPRAPTPVPPAADTSARTPAPAKPPAVEPRKGVPAAYIAAGIVILLLLAGGGYFLTRGGSESTGTPSAGPSTGGATTSAPARADQSEPASGTAVARADSTTTVAPNSPEASQSGPQASGATRGAPPPDSRTSTPGAQGSGRQSGPNARPSATTSAPTTAPPGPPSRTASGGGAQPSVPASTSAPPSLPSGAAEAPSRQAQVTTSAVTSSIPPQPASAPSSAPTSVTSSVPERAAESGGPSPQDQIRAVLDAYAAAYTRMDVAGVVRLQPSLNRAVLQRSFDSMKAFSVQLRNVQITVTSPTTAVVTCIWDSVFDGKVGGRQRQAPPTTISLQKTGNQWVITDRR